MSKGINNIIRRSKETFLNNVRWLLYSDIRLRDGPDKGGMYGWKNLNPNSYPFIYNEIVGYSITAFTWIHTELGEIAALKAAYDASEWIIKNMEIYGNLLPAGRIEKNSFKQKGELSNLIYAFDNGMIMVGLLNLFNYTGMPELLRRADSIAQGIVDRFYDGSKLIAVLDGKFQPIDNSWYVDVKWSMVPGAYHCKLALGLLELADITNNDTYRKISHSLCDFFGKLQTSDGRFINKDQSETTYLHPHLYACEGLIYSGLKDSVEDYNNRGLSGVKWAIETMLGNGGILPRSTLEKNIEQSDCLSQLLRLVILCRPRLLEYYKKSSLDKLINMLHLRLLDFDIPFGIDRGGMKYQLNLESACSWCTMFSMQALGLLNKRKKGFERFSWLDYYI
jgi:hypothetical protein